MNRLLLISCRREIGYTLTNTATGLDGAPTCSPSPCQTIGGLKYKASFASVAGDADGAEYSLETDSAPANALYRIKLWAFNDADRATGTQSDPSKPAATYGEWRVMGRWPAGRLLRVASTRDCGDSTPYS